MALPKTPLLTTDCVICDRDRRIVLIQRRNEPFKGAYALPGGFVDIGETVEAACRRETLEELGLTVGDLQLVGIYSDRGETPADIRLASPIWLFCLTRQTPRPDPTPRRPSGSKIGEVSTSPSIMPRPSPMPRRS